jgi:putative transposase
MPWKDESEEQQRWQLVCAAEAAQTSFTAICQAAKISRKTGYKWRQRFRQSGGAGLVSRSRRPKQRAGYPQHWRKRLLVLRRQRPTWGARKLHYELGRLWPRAQQPTICTLHRWLAQAGVVPRGRQRSRRGPVQPRPNRVEARRPNDVWTVDFKGVIHTGDGSRLEPLTVRDLATRYGLAICQLGAMNEEHVRRAMHPLFCRYGRPRAIQVDNGPPFGGQGALGLSRLSVWWLRQGIHVQFGRPACPQDNAAHEQWHSVLEAETAQPPARTARAQQARFKRFLTDYNKARPHESLGMRPPAEFYHRSARHYRARLRPSRYPASWPRLLVGAKGYVRWAHRPRLIGRAYAHQHIGLRPAGPGQWRVYLDRHWLGLLVAKDHTGLRPIQLSERPSHTSNQAES